MIKTYELEGVTCDGCVATIRDTLNQIPSVEIREITKDPAQVQLSLADDHDVEHLNVALSQQGPYGLSEKSDSLEEAASSSYYPLVLVLLLVLSLSLLSQWQAGAWHTQLFMRHFMGGFFLIFGFFKLLDLKGFSSSYQRYDLLAARLPFYGRIYPFIEVLLGLFYLSPLMSTAVLWFTLILMSFSTLGVIQSLQSGARIQCACLGTVFNLPMSKITLIEDLAMVVMAAYMLFIL
jgi:copper chaperone CopZ